MTRLCTGGQLWCCFGLLSSPEAWRGLASAVYLHRPQDGFPGLQSGHVGFAAQRRQISPILADECVRTELMWSRPVPGCPRNAYLLMSVMAGRSHGRQ